MWDKLVPNLVEDFVNAVSSSSPNTAPPSLIAPIILNVISLGILSIFIGIYKGNHLKEIEDEIFVERSKKAQEEKKVTLGLPRGRLSRYHERITASQRHAGVIALEWLFDSCWQPLALPLLLNSYWIMDGTYFRALFSLIIIIIFWSIFLFAYQYFLDEFKIFSLWTSNEYLHYHSGYSLKRFGWTSSGFRPGLFIGMGVILCMSTLHPIFLVITFIGIYQIQKRYNLVEQGIPRGNLELWANLIALGFILFSAPLAFTQIPFLLQWSLILLGLILFSSGSLIYRELRYRILLILEIIDSPMWGLPNDSPSVLSFSNFLFDPPDRLLFFTDRPERREDLLNKLSQMQIVRFGIGFTLIWVLLSWFFSFVQSFAYIWTGGLILFFYLFIHQFNKNDGFLQVTIIDFVKKEVQIVDRKGNGKKKEKKIGFEAIEGWSPAKDILTSMKSQHPQDFVLYLSSLPLDSPNEKKKDFPNILPLLKSKKDPNFPEHVIKVDLSLHEIFDKNLDYFDDLTEIKHL